MMQHQFATHIITLLQEDESVLGLAAAGSWIGNNMDEFSDLDLVIVTTEKIAGDREKMISFAQRFGHLLSAFTGEHVGESRLLICLYADPFLHVDFKFLLEHEFSDIIEKPEILYDRTGLLKKILDSSEPHWPFPGFQWIEDRFWVWIHYLVQKLARGEYFEVLDGLSFIRKVVLAPLIRLHNGQLPKGIRKFEMECSPGELDLLRLTLSDYDAAPLFTAISNAAAVYKSLRVKLFDQTVVLRKEAEDKVMEYVNGLSGQFTVDEGR